MLEMSSAVSSSCARHISVVLWVPNIESTDLINNIKFLILLYVYLRDRYWD